MKNVGRVKPGGWGNTTNNGLYFEDPVQKGGGTFLRIQVYKGGKDFTSYGM